MKLARRKFLGVGGSAILLGTAGCDQFPAHLFPELQGAPARNGPFSPPDADSIDAISHALNRLTFGTRPGDYGRVKKLHTDPHAAAAAFAEEQLAPEQLDDRRCDRALRRFETLEEPLGELFEYQERLLLSE